jgi:hypothetical protein
VELFAVPSSHTQVPGFSLCLDYITPEEEQALLAEVDREPWQSDWRRRIQQYGLGYREGVDSPAWVCLCSFRHEASGWPQERHAQYGFMEQHHA